MNKFTVTFFPETDRGPVEEFRGENLMVSIEGSFILITYDNFSNTEFIINSSIIESAVFEEGVDE